MRIGIDARLYGLQHAGIGRYVMNLVSQLQQLDTTNHYVLFLRRDDYDTLNLPPNWTKILADVPHYTLKEQFIFPHLIDATRVDLMHFTHFNVPLFYNRPFVVTIHDLLWHDIKGLSVTTLNPLVYLFKYGGYRLVVNHALSAAQAILVPSFWVSQQLKAKFNLPTPKISVTYEGIATTFSDSPDASAGQELLHRLKLTSPFVVYTGSAYPHKNLRLLFAAIKLLKDQGIKLTAVIVSSRSIFLDQLKHFVARSGISGQVIFAGFLTDRELSLLYHQAQALVHPSLSEGFGLTGLEAMAAGLPVVSSRAGSLPEIYQSAALYFDPYEVTDLVVQLKLILTDDQLVRDLRVKGKALSQRYTWVKTAQETLKVYRKVL